ncbi:sugar ABC transporter permease [Humibacter sp. BT305]|uniref:Sugar ABC transporter permease n=1 Tax=Cnuibacter physcomitrellae TaxID=1619308 RepID=A0A1X9LNG9_9MICO|nr:sugar ABC transporter permease [Cnuibacter physcomitrellae]ARJ04679.1 sugar ABC transporter permease [Cnuibacter physcomitrellae]AXH36669.1 sugar ABC transporter permease [Humibacter sp. BT305]MCS5499279.1 sugar ABC transporter permease [Cnuibacter physcomitrellae]GGI42147.1 sugar ABC transporter permease [Cnuibacter physcomitrellae]
MSTSVTLVREHESGGVQQVPQTLPGSGRRPRRRRRAGGLTPAALLVPACIVLAVVIGWPLIQLFIMSFQEFGRAQVFGAPAPFVGFENYVRILTDPQFWAVLARSIAFCAVNVAVTMVLGTLIALLMTRLNRFFRLLVSVGLLLAWAMPALTAVIVWGWMFDTQYGVVNYVVGQLSGSDWGGHSWLIEPLSFFAVATVIVVWGAVPFVAFTVYAGLTQVPDEVLEAAQLDGAGGWQRFRLVVFPYLRSIFIVVTVLQVIWDLRVFTQIFALQGIGGVREQTSTLGVYIYQTSVGSGDYGAGGAMAVIMVILMMAISLYYVRRTLKEEEL